MLMMMSLMSGSVTISFVVFWLMIVSMAAVMVARISGFFLLYAAFVRVGVVGGRWCGVGL